MGDERPLTVGKLKKLLEKFDDNLIVMAPSHYGHGYPVPESGIRKNSIYEQEQFGLWIVGDKDCTIQG